ncbi:MAG: hypothetical protein AB2566_01740, partial [Candidatus Thiodiazotropha sp.]
AKNLEQRVRRVVSEAHPSTKNSKLKTQNSKLKTQNSKLKTQNSKLKTQNSKLKKRNLLEVADAIDRYSI